MGICFSEETDVYTVMDKSNESGSGSGFIRFM